MKTHMIRIPACEQHQGLFAIERSVPWFCIYCGAERGEHQQGLSFDGSRRLSVSIWDNPCGHVESYASLRSWIKVQDELATVVA